MTYRPDVQTFTGGKFSMEDNRAFLLSQSPNSTVVCLDRESDQRARARKPAVAMACSLSVVGLLFITFCVAVPRGSGAEVGVGISVRIGPPVLPVYAQPPCPGSGYLWTPGYWAYDPAGGYYWVPGTWVVPPQPGLLWTPGYWGWGGAAFFWHAGYWGPHVGFYGGINYGFGYPGFGFVGGEWRGREFFYNRAVNNFGGRHITNVYYRQVRVNNYVANRVSYNGGRGGVNARPGRAEIAAEHERHFQATSVQRQHMTMARQQRSQFARVNHGLAGGVFHVKARRVSIQCEPKRNVQFGRRNTRKRPAPELFHTAAADAPESAPGPERPAITRPEHLPVAEPAGAARIVPTAPE